MIKIPTLIPVNIRDPFNATHKYIPYSLQALLWIIWNVFIPSRESRACDLMYLFFIQTILQLWQHWQLP